MISMLRKIKVTEANIKDGVRSNEERCPIALAMIDAELDKPQAGPLYLRAFIGGVDCYAVLPTVAFRFEEDFDHQKLVDPFEFWADFCPLWDIMGGS